MKNKTLLLFFSFFLFAFSCEKEKEHIQPVDDTEEVIILHTNDMHGNINNFPRLAFIVDSIENLYDNVYLFSAGDIFSGNPIVDMNEDKGMPMIDLMNKVGYDLSELGNHEFDYGQAILNKRVAQAQFPFICANVNSVSGEFIPPAPFVKLLTKNNNEIDVIGVIENFGADEIPATHPLKVQGLKFADPFTTALKYKSLADESNVLIGLTHIGASADEYLAKQMPELDIIIGGHSHTTIDQKHEVNNVMICQAGSKLRYVGEIKLKLKNGEITDKQYKLIKLDNTQRVDLDLKSEVETYNDNPIFKEIIGKATNTFGGKEELGSFFTDGLTFQPEIDIAFQNDGGIRIGSIPAGDISMLQIFQMDPFGNGLLALEMTTNEIRSLIRSGFYSSIGLRVSGIKYTVVTKNGKVSNIKLQYYNGDYLDENATYKVGISDYIYNANQFDHQFEPLTLGKTTAESIIEFIKDKKQIDYKGVQRTFIEANK